MVQTDQSRLTFLAADPSAAEGGWPRPERPALRLKTRVRGFCGRGQGQSRRRRRKALGTATGCKGGGCKSVSGQEYGVQTDPNGLLYMRARYYNPYICRFLNPDPSGFNAGLNFYAFCNDNPISLEDPFGLGANNVVGLGGSYPANPYAPGGAYYVPGPIPSPGIGGYLLGGVVIGGIGAAAVTVAAPLTYSLLTAAGVSAATASATVTTTLGATAIAGGLVTVYNAGQNAVAGNWNNVAFDVGTVAGGAFFGGIGGGRFIADNASPSASTVPYSWNPFIDSLSTPEAPNGYGFQRNPNLPLGQDLGNWLGTGPTPSSGGGSAMLINSGASVFMQPSGTASPTGK